MRFNTPAPTLFAVSSLFCLGSSLPFFRREPIWLEPLIRRATYSVVAVDGGSAATTTANEVAATIIATITETPAAETKTIIETDSVTVQSVITDYKTSTQTIKGSETTATVVVTVTPSATILTTTPYSVVDVSPPTSTETSTYLKPNPSSSTPLSPQLTTSTPSLETPAPSPNPSTTALEISISVTSSSFLAVTSYTSKFTVSAGTSTITSTFPSASSTKIYDDGQWHTTYPTWSNGSATATKPALAFRTAMAFPIAMRGEDSLASGLFARAAAIGALLLHNLGL